MKKVLSVAFALLAVSMLSLAAFGNASAAQNVYSYIARYVSGGAALLTVEPQGSLLVATGASAVNAASGVAFVTKASAGRVVQVNVISASGVGAIYDSATVASGVAATQVAAIPATVGTYTYDWPMTRGIVINPSSSVISVKYE